MNEIENVVYPPDTIEASDENYLSLENYNKLNDIENADLIYLVKLYYRLYRKKLTSYIREKTDRKFLNIIYLTSDCPKYTPNSTKLTSPIEYISEIRKQYPDNNFCILLPIIGLPANTKLSKKLTYKVDGKTYQLEKTSIEFEFFIKNKNMECILYKFPQNTENINIYGIYSNAFSYEMYIENILDFSILPSFIRAARLCVKKMSKQEFKTDIVHCEYLPYFMGSEFEKDKTPAKVIQFFNSLSEGNYKKSDLFWSALNLADKDALRKIKQDKEIKTYLSELFSIYKDELIDDKTSDFEFVYNNYKNIMKKPEIIAIDAYKNLNLRIKKIFPYFIEKNLDEYYQILSSIKKSSHWTILSKSYYNSIFEDMGLAKKLLQQLIKHIEFSSYTPCAFNKNNFSTESTLTVFNSFNSENFRNERSKNKRALIKEFSHERILNNLKDKTLFNLQDVKIYGYLDSLNDVPLLFANISTNIFEEGTDILFNTLFKIFENRKSFQIIIAVENREQSKYFEPIIKFLSENSIFDGKWLIIEHNENSYIPNYEKELLDNTHRFLSLGKFLAASDMFLIPSRENLKSPIHLLGMHYGAVPIVGKIGILNDTVINILDNPSDGNGFKTNCALLREPSETKEFYNILSKAIEIYQNNPASWKLIIKNCMNSNKNWNFYKLEKYNKIYK